MQSTRWCGPVALDVRLREVTVRLARDGADHATRIEVSGLEGDRWDNEPERAAIELARQLLDRGDADAALAHLGRYGQARLLIWDAPPERHVRIRHAPPLSQYTQMRLSVDTAATVREMAATFGYVTSRGTGAGVAGNPAALLEVLALCWQAAPDDMQRELATLITRCLRDDMHPGAIVRYASSPDCSRPARPRS